MPESMKGSPDDLIARLRQEILQADGWASSELASLREVALGYYYGELPAPEAVGRSIAVSTDVADMVEAVVATLLPGFAGDNVVEFEAESDEDVEQAQVESDIVNDVILEQNRGYVFFQEALRDALLLRNGWTTCYVEEVDSVRQQVIEGEVPDDELAQALETLEMGEGVDRVESEERDGKTIVKVVSKRRRLCVAAVDPTSMLWETGWDSVFLDGIRFLAERSYPTRSDLISMGFDAGVVNALAAGNIIEPWAGDTAARYTRVGGSQIIGPLVPSNIPHAMQPIECYKIHYMYDADGDGVAELHRITLAGGSAILEDEVVDFIPYASGTPFLQPHQLNGLGLFDKLRTVQDVKTATLRKWINNLEACNNGRVGVDERTCNLDDAVNTRPGGIVRFKGPPSASMAAFPIVDTGQSALALLGYADKMRSERGGASLDLLTAEAQIAGDTAHGVERQYSSREQLAAMACRTLAETLVRSTYGMVHRSLRAWFTDEVSARVRGEFVNSNPASWPERERINVKSGLSISERSAKKQALEQVLMQQEKILTAGMGGILTDMQQVYHATLDWTRAAAIDNGERYFTNPNTPAAQQASQQKAQEAKQASDIQIELQKQIATAEQQVEAMKSAIDKYKADSDASFKYFDSVLKAQVEAMKLGQANAVGALSAEGVEESGERKPAEGGGGSPQQRAAA